MENFKCINQANQLPLEWNVLADNYFQQIKFLLYAEKFNPCNQRYFLYYENSTLIAAAIVYSLKIDIFTFGNLKSPIKMHIVGIPCSVSKPGIFGNELAILKLKNHINKTQKGFVLFLNLNKKPESKSIAAGRTLPTIVLRNNFKNWNEYLASLRSNYRRRIKLINRENENISFEKLPCSKFSDEMYQQYLNVYKRSSGKLEKLSLDFFINLPQEFILTVCLEKLNVIGWNIGLKNQDTYYFFLGGIDYNKNKIYNTYLRLLSEIVKDGIESNAEFIELGQTAEIAKMRMGGLPQILYMESHHSINVLNYSIKICSPMLEYRRKLENTNAFKEVKI